ncbi:MAG: ABC transporter permease [Acidimicrobiia bacterium]
MRRRENLRIALQGVGANRLRAALTMLGILIGVASVILLVAVGNGSAVAVRKRIESLGTNTLTVFNQRFGFGRRSTTGTQSRVSALTLADVKAIQNPQNAPDVKSVAPTISGSAIATYQGATYTPGSLLGTTPAYESVRGLETSSGRFFDRTDVSQHNRVVVLGPTVVTNLFGSADPVGSTVALGSSNFQVIGVLKSKGTNGLQDQDDVALIPYTTMEDTLTGYTGQVNNIVVEAQSSDVMDAASAEITNTLLATHKITDGVADFNVLNQATLLATSNDTNRVFTVLLGAVAAISLLVGGIGVMNIMLVTVTERTREIGIRKAIGARRSDILGQFLAEAVFLTVLGGAIGVVAGLVGAKFRVVGVTPVVQPYSIALAFGVAVAVGLFFGIYPANRAATLRPIEALRHE